MAHLDRILDAAANRCREGLRVVEDFTRFVLNDAHLTRLLKDLRHDLAAAIQLLPADRLLRSRDTLGDIGRQIETAAERERFDALHVARANAKRVEEALRTLEEYGKCLNVEFAARCEQIRYRFYTIERAIVTTASARERLATCRLYLLFSSTASTSGGPNAEVLIREAIAGGVDAVQLREKDISDRQLIDLAHRIRDWTNEAGALFIMNDRPDIAALASADGVHVGQDDMMVREAREIVGADRIVGVSTHDIDQARHAICAGADYLGVGPIFPSRTKQFADLAGLDFVRQVATEITLPWFAIGGIDTDNVAQVIAAGASRLAVSGAICYQADPGEAARSLRSLLP